LLSAPQLIKYFLGVFARLITPEVVLNFT